MSGVLRVAFRGSVGKFALDAAFEAPAVGVTALFGPSGCGKTTVLRCIAGLLRLPDGLCDVDGDLWQTPAGAFAPTHRRPLGYVFQEPSLFSHLSVRRNLLFGAPRGQTGGERAIAFDEIAELLGLTALLDRSPRNLSGGERQRVAIGRALMSQPKLLLMDEPLSALDRNTRNEILPFLERLHDRLSLPIIYVTHDIAEVDRLADHVVLMRKGRVVASGRLTDIQSDPSLPLGRARDAAVGLAGAVEGYDKEYGLLAIGVRGGRFWTPPRKTRSAHAAASGSWRGTSALRASDPARVRSSMCCRRACCLTRLSRRTKSSSRSASARTGRESACWRGSRASRGRRWALRTASAVYAQVKAVALAPGRDEPAPASA